MLPGRFVDGGKEADDFIAMSPVVEKMGESAYCTNYDETEPEIKCGIHEFIITLVVWFR